MQEEKKEEKTTPLDTIEGMSTSESFFFKLVFLRREEKLSTQQMILD